MSGPAGFPPSEFEPRSVPAGGGLTNAERDAQSGGLLRHMMDDTRSLRESEVGVDDDPEGASAEAEHGENPEHGENTGPA